MLAIWLSGGLLTALPMFTGSNNGAWLLGVMLLGFASFKLITKAAHDDAAN